jgi:hypothetical protein
MKDFLEENPNELLETEKLVLEQLNPKKNESKN